LKDFNVFSRGNEFEFCLAYSFPCPSWSSQRLISLLLGSVRSFAKAEKVPRLPRPVQTSGSGESTPSREEAPQRSASTGLQPRDSSIERAWGSSLLQHWAFRCFHASVPIHAIEAHCNGLITCQGAVPCRYPGYSCWLERFSCMVRPRPAAALAFRACLLHSAIVTHLIARRRGLRERVRS